jgi:anti-sigma B factor antagonist
MPQGHGPRKSGWTRRGKARGSSGGSGAGSDNSQGAKPPRSANRLEVARASDTIIVRVVGLGSVNNAGALRDFASQSMEDGWRRFALDLSECRGLDSTFLGTVVGISQDLQERGGNVESWVCVINAADDSRELFEIVGADKYVRFKPCVVMVPLETEGLASGLMSTEKRLDLVRRAHENLISIDRRNEARFGEFLRCLAAELAKKPDEPPPDSGA